MVLLLLLAATGGALLFRLVLHTDIVYTHFMYIPIALACTWWGRRGMLAAVFLAIVVLSFDLLGLRVNSIWTDALRITFFVLVALFIGSLKDRETRQQQARSQSESKRMELVELARKQEEQLEHSTRLAELGEMAAAISHELNQPLTGIRNYARNAFYMIDKGLGSDEEVKANLRLISEQVDRAAKIINEMRELTRKDKRHFARLNIGSVIRETLEFLLPQMKLSGVEVHSSLDVNPPDIWGDRIRLSQVFLNILTNARQAMKESPIRRLNIQSYSETGSDGFVVVEIADTGKGFPAGEASKLFAPFYTTKESGHGTGLGLSISRSIIKDHGGSIEARGESGNGATFTIRLPIAAQTDGEQRQREDHE